MSYLRYVASATRAAAGGSRSEPDRYRSGHTRQGCHLHTNHRETYELSPFLCRAPVVCAEQGRFCLLRRSGSMQMDDPVFTFDLRPRELWEVPLRRRPGLRKS